MTAIPSGTAITRFNRCHTSNDNVLTEVKQFDVKFSQLQQ